MRHPIYAPNPDMSVCMHWFPRPRSRTSGLHPVKMASVVNYLIQSLEDFVILAIDSPLRAASSGFLIASLALSSVWGSWIVRLQQSAPLNVTGIFNATQGANSGVASPPQSHSTNRPSHNTVGNGSTRSEQGPRGLYCPGVIREISNRPQRVQNGPIGLQSSRPNLVNGFNPSGNNLVIRPHRNRGGVSFYPSTSLNYRGKSDLSLPGSFLAHR